MVCKFKLCFIAQFLSIYVSLEILFLIILSQVHIPSSFLKSTIIDLGYLWANPVPPKQQLTSSQVSKNVN